MSELRRTRVSNCHCAKRPVEFLAKLGLSTFLGMLWVVC